MKRVPAAVVLLALLGVAACGKRTPSPNAPQGDSTASKGSHGPEDGLHPEGLAGVYRFDSHPEFEALEAGPDVWVQLFQLGLKTSTLTLKPDGSLTWTMSGWGLERGRWEVEDDRVFIFMKREGRREWPTLHRGLLVRDGTLVIETADKPMVLRKQ